MRPGWERRQLQAVRLSRFLKRESELAILLAALRVCDSRMLVAAARAALKR